VGRQIAVPVHQDGKYHLVVLQVLVLELLDGLVQVGVVFGMEFLRVSPGDRNVVGIEDILRRKAAARNRILEEAFHQLGAGHGLDPPLGEEFLFHGYAARPDKIDGEDRHDDDHDHNENPGNLD